MLGVLRLTLPFLVMAGSLLADKWNLSYFHDEREKKLVLRGIAFSSDRRGVAVGILEEDGRERPVALVTADAGKRWDLVKLPDSPLTITCREEDICWIPTPKGLLQSEEGGRRWRRISKEKKIFRVHFDSPTHGWAAGLEKKAWETSDGGKTWTPIAAANEAKGVPDHSIFQTLSFSGKYGIIAGNSRAPRKDESLYPDWMSPEVVAKRREWPGILMAIETNDGGKSWKAMSSSLFGTLTAMRLQAQGTGLALLEYFNSFSVPSEVIFIDFRSGKSASVFKEKSVAITDISTAKSEAILAGVEPPGLRALPVPGRVRFFHSAFEGSQAKVLPWKEIPVDYRAEARRVAMVEAPGGTHWAVTDTGMILRLDRTAPTAAKVD